MMTSVCSITLATFSFAADKNPDPQSHLVNKIQLQKLDRSSKVNLKNLETETRQTPRKTSLKKITPKPISPVAINLIKEFEGFERQAYIDTDGEAVIGYGLSQIEGKPVQVGDRVSAEQANAALKAQVQEIQQELDRAIKVKLSDRQLSALASLSFNVGVDYIAESTLIRKINAKDYAGAANEFLRWDKANVGGALVQMPGLTRRRQAERQLFLEGQSL
ncbi:lysozyme [Pleurocapsa sp. FMAR1]|uniref:lysozyme n=1 Tax=Pleurocapsa sp. FMAR1 TaxID=3040204 RepID=UPI0029C97A28|nr:lysozyme [Pleurocapsa sp. FMAR1]